MREARAAVKIKNEHVARVSDVGQLEGGAPYIVMEYLEGLDLAGWLEKHGALPVELAVDFVLQACEAIAEAHALGIVHRDLKPANLFRVQSSDGEPFIKVLDFGISKVTQVGDSSTDMTRTSALMGSPMYMSPEQMRMSKGVDARTDVWALGVILFEILSGEPPFGGESLTDLAIAIATEPPRQLRSLRPNLPPGLEQAIGKCMEKDREQRYPSLGHLALALSAFGGRNARSSVERVVGTLRKAGLFVDASALSTSPFAGTQAEPPMRAQAASSPGVSPPQAVTGPPSRGGTPPMVAMTGPPATAPLPSTAASWGQTGGPPTAPRTSGAVIGLIVALGLTMTLGLAGAGWVLFRHTMATTAVAASPSASTPPASPASPASPAATTTSAAQASPAPVPSAAATDTGSPAVASPAAAAPQPATPRPTPGPPASPAAHSPKANGPATPQPPPPEPAAPPAAKPPAASTNVNCTPPYYFDDQNHRIFKKECL
jgi:serine/threonine-protein kinase